FGQVVQPLGQPLEVAAAVVVPVHEGLDVQAVDDGGLPPQVRGVGDLHDACLPRCRAHGYPTAQTDPVDDDLRALRDACERALTGHGIPRADDLLATIPPGTAVDRYGEGGVVADLETAIAE